MISFDITLSDLGTHDWVWDGERWHCAAGWVRPFGNPALRATATPNGTHTRFLVAETAEHGDWVTLDVGRTTVRLEAGPLGRAPVYVRHRAARVTGDWQITALMDQLPFGALNERAVARLLTRRHRYSTDTVFPDIIRVTERATLAAGPAGMELAYPDPVAHPGRRTPKTGVDLKAAFGAITFDHLINRGVRAVEMSGGADSAIVAYDVFRASGAQVSSFGLIMPGPHRDAQRHRRRAVADAFYLADTEIAATEHLPFGPGRRQGVHDPASSYYCEAFDALAARAAATGVTSMAVGFGGDELMASADTARRPVTEIRLPAWLGGKARAAITQIDDNTAPSALLPTPTLTALGSHAPGMLAAGLWPVAPLADPALVRLCRQLPEEWVAGKWLIRERLAAELDPAVARQPSPESFVPVMQQGMRRNGLPLLEQYMKGDGLILADLGFVEPLVLEAVLTAARRAKTIDSQIADVVRLETALRRIWGEQ